MVELFIALSPISYSSVLFLAQMSPETQISEK